VDIRLYRVIYDAIEDVEKAIKGLLAPVFREVVLGQAEVRQVFKVSKVGTIAGCHVTDGKITRQSKVRLLRGGVVVYEGRIDSLKRFKDDVREVATGYECGIGLEGFNDIKEGDLIEAFTTEEVPK
jgi:translation initiation factor IF-2